MPTLPDILNDYIVKTKERLNQSNLKTYCKCCIDALGEEEGKKTYFPNKTDRIVQHLKKCTHFLAATTSDTRNEIFLLSSGNEKQSGSNKRSCKFLIHYYMAIFVSLLL
jgi:hypothetical protein